MNVESRHLGRLHLKGADRIDSDEWWIGRNEDGVKVSGRDERAKDGRSEAAKEGKGRRAKVAVNNVKNKV